MSPTYRADIDGLRAIAVLSILFFHVGAAGFPGGYVGVDVFFVISGFLITTIIVRELADGSFSVAGFYERRVRRILPALIVTLLATLAGGLFILTPEQLAELGESALATSVFSSNLYFFFGAGYFAGPSEAKPLLHTWSLAVEEQFYILFPLLLLIVHRWRGNRYLAVLITIAAASLAACIAWTPIDATATFFLLPFRAWELMLGALLALGVLPAASSPTLRLLLASCGVAMIVASVALLTPATAFPGSAALLPTVGTALVIYAGGEGGSAVNRALGVRPLVFVGLISYSLYLWHWPIVVYGKLYLINEPTEWQAAALVLASVLIATLSWRYVESPFRDRSRFRPRVRLFGGAAAVSLLVAAAAGTLVVLDGLSGRAQSSAANAAVIADPGWQHWKNCEELGEERNHDPEICRIGADAGDPEFLLWGDSHAMSLASGVHLAARDRGTAGLLAIRTACPPLLGIDRPNRDSCAEFNDAVTERIAAAPGIETVVLAARWTLAADGSRYKNEEGNDVRLQDVRNDVDTPESNVELFERGLERTLIRLRDLNRSTVVIGPVPEIGFDVPAAVFSARLRGEDVNAMIAPSVVEFEQRTRSAKRVLQRLRDRYGFEYLQPSRRLCDESRCRVVIDGVSLYRDDNHLSLRGNMLLADLFAPYLGSR